MFSHTKARLAPLFLVSLASVGFEISLTRYFAIASWSEYGYWVISITMVGFSASGVILSLFKDSFVKRGETFLFTIPLFLTLFACLGYYLTTINPFNPLEFQNRDLWFDQLLNIWKYYAALFPFFFLAGFYIGLYFVLFQEEIPRIYGADLAGAGVGALIILLLMFWIHPFYLPVVLLPFLVLASFLNLPKKMKQRNAFFVTAALLLAAGEVVVVKFNYAHFNEYKSIYPALHVQGNHVVREIKSPRGYFMVLDNFTERLDTDFSNNFEVLKAAGPPTTFGLYNDGNRVTSLPKHSNYNSSYIKAALDAFPFELKPAPQVILIGTRGGFRIKEALSLGAASILALEPDETLFSLIQEQIAIEQDPALKSRVKITNQSPAIISSLGESKFDLIDIASDFLGQADANKFAFTVEAVQGYVHALNHDGIISIPVSIREFTVYAAKMLETVQRALSDLGIAAPADHIMVYRSSWNVRMLVSKQPFNAAQIKLLRSFCHKRSFDTSYFPGIDPAKIQVWNDLPAVSLEQERVLSRSDKANDALMQQNLQILSPANAAFLKDNFFNLAASTYDRPFFYSILRLGKLKQVLNKIALIPREEIGYLINVAVLLQAVLFAIAILGLPLIRWRAKRPETSIILKSILYFAGLGLGFLFLEIFLIEKVAFFLNDRTYAFAVVLSGMLVFSGMGSYVSSAYLSNPKKGVALASLIIFSWILLAIFLLDSILLAFLALPFAAKCALIIILVAPLSFALGFPFPLGLFFFRGEQSNFLPWAWSLNGAFSVISTPLANLLAITAGYKMLLIASLLLYAMIFVMFPIPIRQKQYLSAPLTQEAK
ncbi:MAG TPA: hypothetical protein VK138_14770 [Acidiferrobacterales bacterium]|nr:hypothetical protein [Acidiferrobacterales bacterium]